MCTTRTLVPIPAFLAPYVTTFDPEHPEYGIDDQGRRCLAVDTCLVPAITALWEREIVTLSSCCLHGGGFGSITLPRIMAPGEEPDPKNLIPAWRWREQAEAAQAEAARLRAALEEQRTNFEWVISGASGISRIVHADTVRARLDARDAITAVLCKAIQEIDAALAPQPTATAGTEDGR